MSKIKRICVFCGSSTGSQPDYLKAARNLGDALVERGIGLVYGGANVGTMGQIASTVLRGGGEVIGVIPESLVEKEVAYRDLQDLRVVQTMHERKALMIDLSDGFISLPGGLGTFEEFFEALAWGQLGIHTKPSGVLNVQNYYGKLLEFLDHAVVETFMQKEHRDMLLVHEDPGHLLDLFENYQIPNVDKADWIKNRHRENGSL
ncbi:MAG: TIGR00730 family Rossman fold protein [FCB group bacterium]|nr:TIGR00730 family Rossman fold protein [FCB group bacterium]MBL7028267.1 TIGR00730 family Rossman fold protein [Candidatus Neomarinimicrobiota bacterium]